MSREIRDIDRGWDAALRRLLGLPDVAVTVGLRGRHGSDLVTYATVNEFGGGNVPERSFLRSTVDENRAHYLDRLEGAADAVIAGQSVDLAFGRVGLEVVGDVQRKIRDLKDPPNAPLTIAKKGSANPLIDTGRMRQSVDHEVEVG